MSDVLLAAYCSSRLQGRDTMASSASRTLTTTAAMLLLFAVAFRAVHGATSAQCGKVRTLTWYCCLPDWTLYTPH